MGLWCEIISVIFYNYRCKHESAVPYSCFHIHRCTGAWIQSYDEADWVFMQKTDPVRVLKRGRVLFAYFFGLLDPAYLRIFRI